MASTSISTTLPIRLLLPLCVLLLAGSVWAETEKVPEDWCGTMKVYEQKHLQHFGRAPEDCPINGDCDQPLTRDTWIPDSLTAPMYLRTVVHIFREDDGQNATTTEEEVWTQIAEINADYAQVGIQFVVTLNFINSTEWRNLDESEIDDMKNATAIAPDSCLNVWIPHVEFNYSFGTFPWSFDAKEATGGIVMGQFHWGARPNSVFAHEVGHCLGLWHMFHGVEEVDQCGDCYESPELAPETGDIVGDFCSDTPPGPLNRSCANSSETDSCSGLLWGYTMPENYMGYAEETCLDTFTPQQRGRIRCWVNFLDTWLMPFKAEATNAFGPAPLEADFAVTSHKSVTSWLWDFGDSTTATEDTISHLFADPGFYTVTIDVETSDETYQGVYPGMVAAYADTLSFDAPPAEAGKPLKVDVLCHNYLPLKEINLPFSFGGPFGLVYDSFSTAGLRTEYFELQNQVNYDYFNDRATIALNCSNSESQPYLEPGTGAVVSLWFTVPNGTLSGENPIELISYSGFEPELVTYAGSYPPATIAGTIAPDLSCCTGPSVGNIDGSVDNLITMGDLSTLIDHLFISLTPLACPIEGNVDMSTDGFVSMSDVTKLIDHLFISLVPLAPCP